MRVINHILNPLGDLVFAPFASAPPWFTMTVLSAVAGVFMMIVFKYTSNQAKLKAVSDRTRADLLAMKIFKDELSVTFSSQWDLLRATGKRLWYSLWPPMAVMMIPFVLGIAQLGARYEHRPLPPGESTLVALKLRESAWESNADVDIELPDDVAVETPAMRVPAERTVYWRIHPTAEGDFTLAWQIGGQRITKTLPVGTGLRPVSPRRPTAGWWDQLLYPLEAPFDGSSPVESIDLELPARSTSFFGWDIHWLISFFVLSMLFALLCKPFLKVQL